MPLLLPILLAALLGGPVDRVLLRSGQVIAVSGEIREVDGKLLFRSPTGVLYSIAIEEVDLERTARPVVSEDPVEKGDRKTRHPAKKLNVPPAERDRLLAELAKKKSTGPPADAELLSEPPPLKAPPARGEEDAESEARWRGEARAAREAVQTRKDELAALRQRERQLDDQIRTLLSSGYDPNALSAQVLELDTTRNRIDKTQDALREAQRNLTDLQDRARKAGVAPGWLRD
jgi:hypothetical protein